MEDYASTNNLKIEDTDDVLLEYKDGKPLYLNHYYRRCVPG